MPLVLHDPRVTEGSRLPIALAAGFLPETVEDDPHLLPYLTVGYSHGWIGPSAAFSAGVQVPLFPYVPAIYYGAAIDMYVQPSIASAAGAGFLLSPSVAMPYAQIGTGQDGGASWYTTQGLAFTYGDFEESTFWMPSLALRHEREDGTRAVTLFASAGVPLQEAEWIAIIGVTVEFARARRR